MLIDVIYMYAHRFSTTLLDIHTKFNMYRFLKHALDTVLKQTININASL